MAWERNRPRVANFSPSVRKQVLRSQVMCQLCFVNVASQVDHISNVAKSMDNSVANAQAVCASCHQRKSLSEASEARSAQASRARLPKEKHPGDL